MIENLNDSFGDLVVSGRILYFNVNSTFSGMNPVVGGPAPNEADRNSINNNNSLLAAALVHAALLSGNGERGIIKVTIIVIPETDFIGSS